MSPNQPALNRLPDVADADTARAAATLDWVGMDGIAVPLRIADADGVLIQVPARVAAFVDLTRPDARGIHMSRLYLEVERHLSREALTPCLLRRLLRDFLDSHAGLSGRARLRLRYEHLLYRPALRSAHGGWKAYPVEIEATLAGGAFTIDLVTEVLYSSTCPASAALARQLIQQQFADDFPADAALDREAVLHWLGSERGMIATPHAQRSAARLHLRLSPAFDFPVAEVIDLAERTLATPVQTAVKREDEQAFALLNGQNLMFCEDAARRLKLALDADERILDFRLRASHYESLHPHDAVAIAVKGVAGGFVAELGGPGCG